MLTVLSPAKALNMDPVQVEPSDPVFGKDAMRLAKTARNLPLKDLKSLMHLSDSLARLNRDRYRDFAETPKAEQVKPALFAFNGDTYQGLNAASLDADALRYAGDHLRILSGLYGLLRPMDAIQAHRLEMGSRLKTRRGKSLYDYWGDQIAKALNAQASAIGTDLLLNCASKEYFTAADRPALKLRVIRPTFLENRSGVERIESVHAKKARGAMARFVLENRVQSAEGLRDFDYHGYAFAPEQSGPDAPVFIRHWPDDNQA